MAATAAVVAGLPPDAGPVGIGFSLLAVGIAAAMLLASGWDRTSPLLDPLCGSGTIAVEAALLAAAAEPWIACALYCCGVSCRCAPLKLFAALLA